MRDGPQPEPTPVIELLHKRVRALDIDTILGFAPLDINNCQLPPPVSGDLDTTLTRFAEYFGITARVAGAQCTFFDSLGKTEREVLLGVLTASMADGATPVSPLTPRIDLRHRDAARVVLRANRPVTVTVCGPTDLRFTRAVLQLTGRPLVRDLLRRDAQDRLWWGGDAIRDDASGGDSETTVTLRQPAHVTQVMLVDTLLAPHIATLARNYTGGELLRRAVFAAYAVMCNSTHLTSIVPGQSAPLSTYCTYGVPVPLNADLMTLRLSNDWHIPAAHAAWQVLSPSVARAVAVGIGDDTPQQVLTAELGDGVRVATRDLAAAFQKAWASAPRDDDDTCVLPVSLLSVQDGLVEVRLDIVGDRYRSLDLGATTFALAPYTPLTLRPEAPVWDSPPPGLSLPRLAAQPDAQVVLRSKGSATGGVVQALMATTATARCSVLVDERLHIAQALRLRMASAEPGAAATVVAVWLCLETLPTAAAQLRLTLASLTDAGFVPGQELGSCTVTLPVDRTAYEQRADETCWWFRARWEPGLELDGVQAGRAMALMASGDANGLRLVHAQASALLVPVGKGAGCAHYRHLDRDRSWRPRTLMQDAQVQWLMDVELAPLAAEAVITINGQALHRGGGRWTETAWSGSGQDGLIITSTVAATLALSGEVVAPL